MRGDFIRVFLKHYGVVKGLLSLTVSLGVSMSVALADVPNGSPGQPIEAVLTQHLPGVYSLMARGADCPSEGCSLYFVSTSSAGLVRRGGTRANVAFDVCSEDGSCETVLGVAQGKNVVTPGMSAALANGLSITRVEGFNNGDSVAPLACLMWWWPWDIPYTDTGVVRTSTFG